MLQQWLEYLEQCHPSNIELGLDRVSQVADKLPIDFSGSTVITVAGTNGKGSTVSMLAAILEAAGYSTTSYTSPHILVYNERVRLGSRLVTDTELCESFANVEAARGDTPLTYFEFGTLSALQIFSAARPDFVILEVGLGGRLDAVNIVDPDLAIVTNVALDHTDWLGDTRDAIGFEKAGIFRPGKPALIGEKAIPGTVLAHADAVGARVYHNGTDFNASSKSADTWEWTGTDSLGATLAYSELPCNDFPLDNGATALQAVTLVAPDISRQHLVSGFGNAVLPGRFQVIDKGYSLVLDVAHNPHASDRVVEQMQLKYPGARLHLVIAMLADKDYRQVLTGFRKLRPAWYVAGIQDERGLEAKILYNYLLESGEDRVTAFTNINEAFTAADEAAKAQHNDGQSDTQGETVVLVSGSFFTVSAVLELI